MHDRQSGRFAGPIDKRISRLGFSAFVALVIKLDYANDREITAVHHNKVEVLGLDPAKRGSPGLAIGDLIYLDQIGDPDLAEYTMLIIHDTLEHAKEGALGW